MEWILPQIKKGTWTQIKTDEHGLKRIFISPAADGGWETAKVKGRGIADAQFKVVDSALQWGDLKCKAPRLNLLCCSNEI